ncbi:unnamed protein product [Schistosoma margrebowiei]|uniref:Uncharacterized protein n=1 Tax=Schistosoma margrebowiei TaxID=48269 RepID=A0AA85AMU9_9TREM|nr:unnamed protein product [Schistosoma margrebowiei]
MFWESAAAYSQINDILSRPNLTIKELLDDDDVLQKCREKDPRLINFLSRPDNLDYLIDLVSRTPKSSDFNRDLYRYSSLACEILTNDISEILDGIIELTESTIDQHTPNESHNNESNQIKSILIPSSFSSPLPSSSLIINDHSLTEINNNNDQSCNDMLIVGNNSSELYQINHNLTDHYSNVHDHDGTNHLSSSMSIINESSIINGHNSSQLFDNNNHNNSVNDLNEIFSSSLKLSPQILLSTPHSSPITKITKSNDAIQVDSSTTKRRRLDLLLNFFHYSNQPVNPLSASFVSRLLIHLTLHRGNIIIPYLRSSKEFLDQLFLSLDSSSVADLIIQLSQQETKQQHMIFEWFKTDRLVERLIEKFDPIYSSDAHESAAHCLIELVTVLRNYLVNNPPNLDNSDMLVNSMTAVTTTTNNIGGSSIFGSPLNSTYSSLFDKDEETYKAAENLLNVLESEETMSMLLNRIIANEYVVPSILVSCVNVCIALIGKKKPESSFPVGEDGYGLDFDALIKCSGDLSSNLKFILRNNTNLGNNLSSTVDNHHISDLVEKSNQFITSSKDDNTNTTNNSNTVIDKLHIMKASENLIKTSLPRLNELHDLLKRFHPQFYNCMPTTHCTLNPPLGRGRLAILQLIASLISLPISTNLSKAIVDIGFVKTSMELFALYPYNTFLHHYVTDIIKSVFKHSGLVNTNNGNNNSTNISNDNKTNHLINTTTSTITVELSSNHDNNQITESLFPSISSSSADSSTNTATTDSDNVVSSTNSSNTNKFNPYDNIGGINLIHQNDNEYSKNILISLIKDHQLIDWCLTLSPLPSLNERPNDGDSPSCLVRLSKHPVKSGYSGHIWQIGNLIVAAMNGPYGEFLKSLIQDLHPNTQKLWSDFVKDLDGINSVEVAEISQSAIESLNHSDVPFVLAPVTSSNLMQNKLLDLNGKSSSYFLDDIDNDKHDEYGKNNHEYLAYHPVIPASTIVNLHRQTILQNFMDSWLDPDEESEHNDNNNSIYDDNNNKSEEKDQVKTPDIHIGVPGPLGEMYFHNNSDSDDDFFNGRANEDDEKDENDELEKGIDNIHSRGYFNIEEDDDDDDEEDLKSPIQIKQQHSSKQSIINTSSSTSLLHNDSNKLTEVSYVTNHNNESSMKINSNSKLSTTITTPITAITHTTTINSSISENIEIKLLNNDEETEQIKHNTSSESIVTLLNANFFKK